VLTLDPLARHDHGEPGDNKWGCESGDQVIPISQLCDEEIDCLDGSDEKEENCGRRTFRSAAAGHRDRQQRNALGNITK